MTLCDPTPAYKYPWYVMLGTYTLYVSNSMSITYYVCTFQYIGRTLGWRYLGMNSCPSVADPPGKLGPNLRGSIRSLLSTLYGK